MALERKGNDLTIRKGKNPVSESIIIVRIIRMADTLKKPKQNKIPKEYRHYEGLFKLGAEKSLPKYSEWDYEIILKEGITLRFYKIYYLNELQFEILKKYIDDNLKKGYI